LHIRHAIEIKIPNCQSPRAGARGEVETLEALDMRFPKPTVDLAHITLA